MHAGLAGPYAGRDPPCPAAAPTCRPPSTSRPRPAGGPDRRRWAGSWRRCARDEPVALVATGPWSNVAARPGRPAPARRRRPAGAPRRRPPAARGDPVGGAQRLVRPRPRQPSWAPGWSDVVVTMDATYAAPWTTTTPAASPPWGRARAAGGRLMTERIAWYRRDPELAARRAAPLHDPLAVAVLVEPDVVAHRRRAARWRRATRGGTGRPPSTSPGGAALRVALDADSAAFAPSSPDVLPGKPVRQHLIERQHSHGIRIRNLPRRDRAHPDLRAGGRHPRCRVRRRSAGSSSSPAC